MTLRRKSIINWTAFADGAFFLGTTTPTVQPFSDTVFKAGESAESVPLLSGFWKHRVWYLPKLSVRAGIQGLFDVPPEYVSGGDSAVFVFEYGRTSGDGVESYDKTFAAESLSLTAAAPLHRLHRVTESIPLDDSGFIPGADIQFGLYRNGPAAADNLAHDVLLFGAYLEFQDA